MRFVAVRSCCADRDRSPALSHTTGGDALAYSGIIVRTEPDRLGSIADRLAGLPGVQVHQRDPQTGRVVLTLEAGSSDEEIEGLRRIQRVPGVVSADLVYHRLPPDAESGPAHTPADFGTQRGET